MCIHYTYLLLIQYDANICERSHISGLIACVVSFCFVFGILFVLAEVFKKTTLVEHKGEKTRATEGISSMH